VIDASLDAFRSLHEPVLGHFAERDAMLPASSVRRFEVKMREAGKSLDLHWYAVEHSFANPEQSGYDRQAADAAWARTSQFLHASLDPT